MTRRPILMHRFPDPVLQQLPAEQRAKAQRVLDQLEYAKTKGRYKAAIQETMEAYLGQRMDERTLAEMSAKIRERLAREVAHQMPLSPAEVADVIHVNVTRDPLDTSRINVQVQVQDARFDGSLDLPPFMDL